MHTWGEEMWLDAGPDGPMYDVPEEIAACASCQEPFGAGGWLLTELVWFCSECARRARPGDEYDLGVVD